MRSSFVKKCLSVCCLMSLWSGFSFGEEKKEIGLLLIGGTLSETTSTINTIYNVMKGNNDLEAMDIIIGSFRSRVNVAEYQENSPVKLIQRIGRKNRVRRTIIENQEYRLTIYEPPVVKYVENKEHYYHENLAESFVSDLLSTEDINGIAYFHGKDESTSTHDGYQKALELALSKQCEDHLVSIKIGETLPDDLPYLRNEKISQFLTLDSFPIDNRLIRLPRRQLEQPLLLEWNRELWQKNVRSVRSLLDRISEMSLIDKSKVEKKIKAEIEIKKFIDTHESTVDGLNLVMIKFIETRDHIKNDLVKGGMLSADNSDVFPDSGINLSPVGSDGKMELVKNWGESHPVYKSSQKKSFRDICNQVAVLYQKKSDLVNQIKDSCDILKMESFGNRSCNDFSILNDVF